jgi:ADP-dependent NAD(P)H-hydrate dehydratase
MSDVTAPPSIPRLPPRAADSHKGTYGRVLVVAGSRGMTGAAVLCGTAALRGGAGLVQIAVPGEIQPIVAGGNPCYMTVGLPQDMRGRFATAAINEVIDLSRWADVVAVGPGIGQAESAPTLVQALLARTQKPLVIDADGLNALAKVPNDQWPARSAPVVLTPHPGEFIRLSDYSADDVHENREDRAKAYATDRSVVLVLKGHRSVVTDGTRVHLNPTGNPGMATGGTGDVLTGLLAAVLGQGLAAFDAAVVAVWAHGRAGDLAADARGQAGMIATDLNDHLPAALREVGG